MGQRTRGRFQSEQHDRVRLHLGQDEIQPVGGDELREDVQGHALPLRLGQAGPQGPFGHGQGEEARIQIRRTGHQLADGRGGAGEAVRPPRPLQRLVVSVE